MPKTKIISDIRMLEVMKFWMEKTGMKQGEFCEKIGIHQGNIHGIRNGRQSFQIEHIHAAMKLIGDGNFNFIFGVEDNMFRKSKTMSPLEQLDLAVKSVKERYGS